MSHKIVKLAKKCNVHYTIIEVHKAKNSLNHKSVFNKGYQFIRPFLAAKLII